MEDCNECPVQCYGRKVSCDDAKYFYYKGKSDGLLELNRQISEDNMEHRLKFLKKIQERINND